VYAFLKRQHQQTGAAKRGPRPLVSDEELTVAVQEDIDSSPFTGDGHRKVWARLRYRKGLVVGRNRVLRVMRENNLLSPARTPKRPVSMHTACLATEAPNEMWGTDGTKFYTLEDGWCWLFAVVDHFNSEALGWHISKRGDRFQALEPLRQSVRQEYGKYEKGVAGSLKLRMDNGSQYTSGVFEDELHFLGIEASFTEPYSPESNGIAERFFRTVKEQAVWGHVFKNIEEAKIVIGDFIERYNAEWLLQRLLYRSPKEAKLSYNLNRTNDNLVSNQLVA
jgi:transposase InsO family protein